MILDKLISKFVKIFSSAKKIPFLIHAKIIYYAKGKERLVWWFQPNIRQ